MTRQTFPSTGLPELCGLNLKHALIEICKDAKLLPEMTKSFNGYHFCWNKKVETVYNTETCLAYLQCLVDGAGLQTKNPANSEVSKLFLERFATSPPVITDLEKALKCDKDGGFAPLKYDQVKEEFALEDLVC